MTGVLFHRSADCVSFGSVVGNVTKCTALRRQFPLGASQLTRALEVGSGRCAQ